MMGLLLTIGANQPLVYAQTEAPIPAPPSVSTVRSDLPISHPSFAQADDIQVISVFDSLAKSSSKYLYTAGYRVLLYAGSNRKLAESAKAAAYRNFPDLDLTYEYKMPNFRVRAGNFHTRLEAEANQRRVRVLFPDAIIVPEPVKIKD